MKKRILFVIDSLICAGGEKSLITLLNILDYSKYEVDLQLFTYGGEFEVYIPKEVNLLPPLHFASFVEKSLLHNLLHLADSENRKMLKARLKYSYQLRKEKGLKHAGIARLYWDAVSECIPVCNKEYDYAIAYAQCIPTFYVVEKVKARKKMGWVNCIFHLEGKEKIYQSAFYGKLDHIVCVSQASYDHFVNVYPQYASQMTIVKDIVDADFINRLANRPCRMIQQQGVPNILTVARLNKEMKGFDIALSACKILRDRGLKFKWYVLGKGPYESEMRQFIADNALEEYFILLGTDANPYPYYKNATLYVQTSRHEGFGLSIAEARLLNIPVVTTEFDAVYVQMVPNKNGLVVPLDSGLVADAIEKILTDKELYQSICSYLKTEKKGNTEELQKFYGLLE